MVLHDRTNGDDDSFWSSDPCTSEIRGMEVVEPSGHFARRGVGEKEADLAFDMLPITVNTRMNRLKMKAHLR